VENPLTVRGLRPRASSGGAPETVRYDRRGPPFAAYHAALVDRPALLQPSRAELRERFAAAGLAPRWADVLRRALLHGWDPASGPPPVRRAQPPRDLLERVAEIATWSSLREHAVAASPDGVSKSLFRLHDGEAVEAVALPGARRPSACLSTQVGCAMACRFCASGLDGVRRNLAAHEVLEQLALLRRRGPVQRLVLMGAGEPTRNLRAVVAALRVLRDEGSLGPRHVLLSSVGPAAAIRRVTATGLPVTLALSLHAPDRALRAELVPTQPDAEPAELLDACDAHSTATGGRPYQVEYVLLGGVNDAPAHAAALSDLLHGRRAHVSLIAWNAVPGLPFAAPSPPRAAAFLATLRRAGVSAALRRTLGAPATAACGQLRASRAV